MFIIDTHLDLAMNAMEWNRDLRQPIAILREREKTMTDKPDRAKGTVSFPELRKGNVGLVVATQLARVVQDNMALPGSGWHSPQQAWAQTQGQLQWYKAMEACGEMVMIKDWESLESHVAWWTDGSPNEDKPIGYILSLEGADSLVDLDYLDKAYAYGLRAIGPAHYGSGRYANGTDATGGLHAMGRELLRKMEDLNIILDATHLCDDAFWEALELFNGPIWASHNNCRALVDHNRQFSDEMIKALIERGAVIGLALDAWMMVPNWIRGVSTPKGTSCSLATMLDHLDHICQLAGSASFVTIGTDLDGAFGKEQCPDDLETIADLQKLPDMLQARGYSAADIKAIMHGNCLRFLKNAWT
ncbi:dipeptidase [Olivibacter sitiensis]|uniref:dipeptidase n=1 Tax=Olivibacter sitiensis TaxID=376470 RepID=UPI0004011B4E|nr:membrane dipeptidase [Olivibacter sitiensis]